MYQYVFKLQKKRPLGFVNAKIQINVALSSDPLCPVV